MTWGLDISKSGVWNGLQIALGMTILCTMAALTGAGVVAISMWVR